MERAKLRQQVQLLRNATMLVTFGEERCASTFQFYALTRIAQVLHSPTAVRRHYRRRLNDTSLAAIAASAGTIHVVKTHSLPELSAQPPSWLAYFQALYFPQVHMIRRRKWLSHARNGTPWAIVEPVYKQVYVHMLQHGWESELAEYTRLFGLAPPQSAALHAHLRYWSILRRCCGLQASIDRFNELRGKPPRHALDSYEHVDCRVYNLEHVERLFRETSISRRFGSDFEASSGPTGAELAPDYCRGSEARMREGAKPKFNVFIPRRDFHTRFGYPPFRRRRS